jgi:hypothetical protein
MQGSSSCGIGWQRCFKGAPWPWSDAEDCGWTQGIGHRAYMCYEPHPKPETCICLVIDKLNLHHMHNKY